MNDTVVACTFGITVRRGGTAIVMFMFMCMFMFMSIIEVGQFQRRHDNTACRVSSTPLPPTLFLLIKRERAYDDLISQNGGGVVVSVVVVVVVGMRSDRMERRF